jgi:hypothetical protein
MRIGRKCFLLIALTPLLASCATAPPNLRDVRSERIAIPARKVIIADYTSQKKYSPYDAVWSGGFNPLPNSATVPPITELVLNNLNTRLYGNADNGGANVEITVLDASLLMESHIADSVMFVGIASAFSERKYMCRVDVNFRYGDRVVRKVFEAVDSKSRGWGDLPTNEKGAMVHKLLDQVIRDIASFSSELITREQPRKEEGGVNK